MANGNYPERSNRKRTASYVLFGLSALLILLLAITPSRKFIYGIFGYAVYAYLPIMVVSAVLLFTGHAPTAKPGHIAVYIATFIMAVATLHIGLSADLISAGDYLGATYASGTVGGVLIGLIAALLKLICVDNYGWMLAVSFVITALLALVAIYPLIVNISGRAGGKRVKRHERPKESTAKAPSFERPQPYVPKNQSGPYDIVVDDDSRQTYDLSGTSGTHPAILEEPRIPQPSSYKGRGAELLFGKDPVYPDPRSERKSTSPYAALDSLGQEDFNRAITNQERRRLFEENLGRKSDAEEYDERFGGSKLDGGYAAPRNVNVDSQYGVATDRVVPNAGALYEPQTPAYTNNYNSEYATASTYGQAREPQTSNTYPSTASYGNTYAKEPVRPTPSPAQETRKEPEKFKDRASMIDFIRRPISTDEYGGMNIVRELPSDNEAETAQTAVNASSDRSDNDYGYTTLPSEAPVAPVVTAPVAPVPVTPVTPAPAPSNAGYTAEPSPKKPVYSSNAMRKEEEPELARQARMADAAQKREAESRESTPAPVQKKPYVPKPYVAPPYELLRDYGDGCGTFPPDYEEVKSKLEMTMEEFNVPATVEKAVRGPSFTMYYLKLGPGYKINKITSLKENLKMRLRVKNLRILAPIEGCDNFGIELPNEKRDRVGLRSILCSKEFNEKNSGIQVAFGKTLDGDSYVADLAKMPHLLVAGATGTGKSVFLNALITSILFKYSPEEVRMILIDPKRVELSVYRGLPNLLIKETIKEPKHSVNVLKWLTQEMDRRYAFFEEKGCANIDQYNSLYRQPDEPKMYRIVLIVDEMADLMMKSKDNTVEECIVRIAQLARACGIHMVIATQRPIVKVITGLIKGNILHRVAFTVKSNQDSRVILDDGGAEELLGLGDMLYSFPSNLVRIQGALVEIDEIKAVCDFIRANNEGDFDEELVKIVTYEPPKPETPEEKSQAREEERDADFERLLRKILKSFILEQRASVSSAQASHHVGYIKARKLIDAMTERGFLSKGDGAKPRDILITLDQYYEIFGKDGDADINQPEDDSSDDE